MKKLLKISFGRYKNDKNFKQNATLYLLQYYLIQRKNTKQNILHIDTIWIHFRGSQIDTALDIKTNETISVEQKHI